jgi:hypothetical protein
VGIRLCCGRRGAYSCRCRAEGCRGCGLCVEHRACSWRAARRVLERLGAAAPEDGLDDPTGPFATHADE